MEKAISWRAESATEDNEIPAGSTVTFEREDGKQITVKFAEDESVQIGVKSGELEYVQSYFVPEPDPVPWEDVLLEADGIEIYQNKLVPDYKAFEPQGKITPFGEGEDEKRVLTVMSSFPKELLGEMQQVLSPVFAVETDNGKVIMPDDPRMIPNEDGTEKEDMPEFEALKCENTTVSIEDYRQMSMPGSDEMRAVVKDVCERLVSEHGWRYLYYIEERGDGTKTYIYARGC